MFRILFFFCCSIQHYLIYPIVSCLLFSHIEYDRIVPVMTVITRSTLRCLTCGTCLRGGSLCGTSSLNCCLCGLGLDAGLCANSCLKTGAALCWLSLMSCLSTGRGRSGLNCSGLGASVSAMFSSSFCLKADCRAARPSLLTSSSRNCEAEGGSFSSASSKTGRTGSRGGGGRLKAGWEMRGGR